MFLEEEAEVSHLVGREDSTGQQSVLSVVADEVDAVEKLLFVFNLRDLGE